MLRDFMKMVISSWRESFLLWKLSTFKLFMLVSLNTAIRTAKTVGYWGLLVGGIVAGAYYGKRWGFDTSAFMNLVFGFILLVAARPSTYRKDYWYLASYLWYLPVFLLPWGIGSLVGIDILPAMWLTLWYLNPLMIFFMFFLFDVGIKKAGRAFINASSIVLFNLPWVGLLYGALVPVFLVVTGRTRVVPIFIFVVLLLYFYVILLVNFYTKRIHDQSNIYFPECFS